MQYSGPQQGYAERICVQGYNWPPQLEPFSVSVAFVNTSSMRDSTQYLCSAKLLSLIAWRQLCTSAEGVCDTVYSRVPIAEVKYRVSYIGIIRTDTLHVAANSNRPQVLRTIKS